MQRYSFLNAASNPPNPYNDYPQRPGNFNIDRQTKWDTFTIDMLHFHAKLLDWYVHWQHYFVSENIQQNNGMVFSCTVAMNGSRIFQPTQAFYLYLSIHSTEKCTHSQLQKLAAHLISKFNKGGNFVMSTHIVNARLACLVSIVEARILIVLTLSSIKFSWGERWRRYGFYQCLSPLLSLNLH